MEAAGSRSKLQAWRFGECFLSNPAMAHKYSSISNTLIFSYTPGDNPHLSLYDIQGKIIHLQALQPDAVHGAYFRCADPDLILLTLRMHDNIFTNESLQHPDMYWSMRAALRFPRLPMNEHLWQTNAGHDIIYKHIYTYLQTRTSSTTEEVLDEVQLNCWHFPAISTEEGAPGFPERHDISNVLHRHIDTRWHREEPWGIESWRAILP
jgi:hypothetical protein